MKGKVLLATFLLAASLCLVPTLGHGEESKETLTNEEVVTGLRKLKVNALQYILLEAKVNYMMRNPTSFLNIDFHCTPEEVYGREFPGDIPTKNKLVVEIYDNRGRFAGKSGIALLNQFKRELEAVYSYAEVFVRNMDANVVAKFYSEGGIPLGYFYQGEYHLWGSNAGNVCFEAARHM